MTSAKKRSTFLKFQRVSLATSQQLAVLLAKAILQFGWLAYQVLEMELRVLLR